ncbi:hypothetical protein [Crenothrix polyspora]|nr:hypothetical protein [Crenothrix polyspora]
MHPQSKVHVATAQLNRSLYPVKDKEDRGTLGLGRDNCFYIELDNGEKVLPVLTTTYSSPESLSFWYKKAVGKKIVGIAIDSAIDLTPVEDNGWLTLPPGYQCDKLRVQPYWNLELYAKSAESFSGEERISIIDPQVTSLPKSNAKIAYIGGYSYPAVFDFVDDPFAEGELFIKKDCLYIRFTDGHVALPVFTTQRTYWQDNKKALRASGKDWFVGQRYFFQMYSDHGSGGNDLTSHLVTADREMIIPPHYSGCNLTLVHTVKALYQPDDYAQEKAAYIAKVKAIEKAARDEKVAGRNPAMPVPVVSKDVLNELKQLTQPQSKVHVASLIIGGGGVLVHPVGGKDACVHLQECEIGRLRLGSDNCYYLVLDSGDKVLPILLWGYDTPQKLAEKYNSWLGKKMKGYYGNHDLDLMSTDYNPSNIGWVTPPPHQQCDISKVHQYLSFNLYNDGSPVDETVNEPTRVIDEMPPGHFEHDKKWPYIAVYNTGLMQSDGGGDGFLVDRHFEEGQLFTEKDCLYIRFKNGKVALPLFSTQRTFWNDAKNTLRASGKDWQLGKSYFFGISADESAYDYNHDHDSIIVEPHLSCNSKRTHDVYNIYQVYEYKQKVAAFEVLRKAREAAYSAELDASIKSGSDDVVREAVHAAFDEKIKALEAEYAAKVRVIEAASELERKVEGQVGNHSN